MATRDSVASLHGFGDVPAAPGCSKQRRGPGVRCIQPDPIRLSPMRHVQKPPSQVALAFAFLPSCVERRSEFRVANSASTCSQTCATLGRIAVGCASPEQVRGNVELHGGMGSRIGNIVPPSRIFRCHKRRPQWLIFSKPASI